MSGDHATKGLVITAMVEFMESRADTIADRFPPTSATIRVVVYDDDPHLVPTEIEGRPYLLPDEATRAGARHQFTLRIEGGVPHPLRRVPDGEKIDALVYTSFDCWLDIFRGWRRTGETTVPYTFLQAHVDHRIDGFGLEDVLRHIAGLAGLFASFREELQAVALFRKPAPADDIQTATDDDLSAVGTPTTVADARRENEDSARPTRLILGGDVDVREGN